MIPTHPWILSGNRRLKAAFSIWLQKSKVTGHGIYGRVVSFVSISFQHNSKNSRVTPYSRFRARRGYKRYQSPLLYPMIKIFCFRDDEVGYLCGVLAGPVHGLHLYKLQRRSESRKLGPEDGSERSFRPKGHRIDIPRQSLEHQGSRWLGAGAESTTSWSTNYELDRCKLSTGHRECQMSDHTEILFNGSCAQAARTSSWSWEGALSVAPSRQLAIVMRWKMYVVAIRLWH